jgi:hypothetical protein
MLKSESFQLRLTKPQMARLTEVMHATGLGKAEHIRRAVDYYLAGWRQEAHPPEVQPQSGEPVRAPPTPLVEPKSAPVPSRSSAPPQATRDTRALKVARR